MQEIKKVIFVPMQGIKKGISVLMQDTIPSEDTTTKTRQAMAARQFRHISWSHFNQHKAAQQITILVIANVM